MILVSKIFHMSNYMKILPCLVQPGRLATWINFFVSILDSQQDATSSLVCQTTSAAEIDQLDKQEWWKLKAICSKISVKLFQKCNDKKNADVNDKKVLKNFTADFQSQFMPRLLQSHVGILMLRKTQFVGTKALCLSLKFITQTLVNKEARRMLEPHIQEILFDISLPMFMISEKEYSIFQTDAIEFVRLQIDFSNQRNIKIQLANFVEQICSVKTGRKEGK